MIGLVRLAIQGGYFVGFLMMGFAGYSMASQGVIDKVTVEAVAIGLGLFGGGWLLDRVLCKWDAGSL